MSNLTLKSKNGITLEADPNDKILTIGNLIPEGYIKAIKIDEDAYEALEEKDPVTMYIIIDSDGDIARTMLGEMILYKPVTWGGCL